MRLMVLSGGSNQIALIKKAKDKGLFVVLIDYLENCPGKEYADVHVKVSTFDINGVLDAARKYDIKGIVTAGTDQPVLTAASVSEQLGLNFYLDANTALNVTNKIYMKEVFRNHNIPCVNYRFVKAGFDVSELDGLRFPVVLKPVDSQGQRGIFKLDNAFQVKEKICETLSFSRQELALVEEYYKNDEITVNGLVIDGDFEILSVVDRVTMRDRIGVCIAHNAQSVYLEAYSDEIKSITGTILKAFNIRNGPIYFQYLIGDTGIKVNEIAMRVGGAYEGITIPIISGVDILDYVTDYACGRVTRPIRELELKKPSDIFLSTQLYFCKEGKVVDILIDDVRNLSFVHDVFVEYKIGDVVPKTENATARAGYFIVSGDSFDAMLENVDCVFDKLKIMNESGENLVKRYGDYKNKYLFTDKYR